MFKRLRKALVTSFVGAVALGWVFAQGILHFAYAFSAPLAEWVRRREYQRFTNCTTTTTPTGIFFHDALLELVRSLSLLLFGYFLLRWLYFKPLEQETTESGSEQSSQS
jgi:hypothetical protein